MLTEKEIKKFNALTGADDKRLAIIFKALSDPKRCRIYRLLLKKSELRTSDIARIMKISLPSVSQHLKILEITGLLNKEKKGRTILFKINKEDQIVSALIKAVL